MTFWPASSQHDPAVESGRTTPTVPAASVGPAEAEASSIGGSSLASASCVGAPIVMPAHPVSSSELAAIALIPKASESFMVSPFDQSSEVS